MEKRKQKRVICLYNAKFFFFCNKLENWFSLPPVFVIVLSGGGGALYPKKWGGGEDLNVRLIPVPKPWRLNVVLCSGDEPAQSGARVRDGHGHRFRTQPSLAGRRPAVDIYLPTTYMH